MITAEGPRAQRDTSLVVCLYSYWLYLVIIQLFCKVYIEIVGKA